MGQRICLNIQYACIVVGKGSMQQPYNADTAINFGMNNHNLANGIIHQSATTLTP